MDDNLSQPKILPSVQGVEPAPLTLEEPVGSFHKEAEPIRAGEQKESVVAKEVQPWAEKENPPAGGEEIHLPQPVPQPAEDQYSQILMEAAAPSKPQITLPLDDQTIKKPPTTSITASLTWLITWCKRLIKKAIRGGISRGPNK